MEADFEKPGVATTHNDQLLEELKDLLALFSPEFIENFTKAINSAYCKFHDSIPEETQIIMQSLMIACAAYGIHTVMTSMINQRLEDEGVEDKEL